MLDESDNALNNKDNELFALLNGGHTRDTAIAVRTVGDNHEPAMFSTWSPKAFALIGKMRDTVMDRAINIDMRRRKEDEEVESKRLKQFAALCLPVRRQLVRWSQDVQDEIADLEPEFPPGLRDRAQDNWQPLLTIAQLAGPEWLSRTHRAALLLSGGEESNDDSPGVQLLQDCREIFRGDSDADVITTLKLGELLNAMEDRPYRDRRNGKGISGAWLAKHLKPFGIQPAGTVRIGAETAKGYRRAAFTEAWARYLPPCDGQNGSCDVWCDVSEAPKQPIKTESCYLVTPVTPATGGVCAREIVEEDGCLKI